MVQLNYIQELKRQARGRNLSNEWYRKKIQELGRPTSTQLMRDGKRGNRPYVGKLNMVFYMSQSPEVGLLNEKLFGVLFFLLNYLFY